MRTSPIAQREINPARVDYIPRNFDPEDLGNPNVSQRSGLDSIIDGQHRVEALKVIGWEDQQIQCCCYDGLTEQEEAERFLTLNATLTVNARARYRIGVTA